MTCERSRQESGGDKGCMLGRVSHLSSEVEKVRVVRVYESIMLVRRDELSMECVAKKSSIAGDAVRVCENGVQGATKAVVKRGIQHFDTKVHRITRRGEHGRWSQSHVSHMTRYQHTKEMVRVEERTTDTQPVSLDPGQWNR